MVPEKIQPYLDTVKLQALLISFILYTELTLPDLK